MLINHPRERKAFHGLILIAVTSAVLAQVNGGANAEDAAAYPTQTIGNGIVAITIYLPDSEHGYYRGARFDWSGMLAQVEYHGHTFLGPWQTRHVPNRTDFAIGTAEEFGMETPLGFEQAAVGGAFLKIGVGELEKTSDPYKFFRDYKIRRPGTWTITSGADWIGFHQEMGLGTEWGYRYDKRIVLDKAAASFTISHLLVNTGAKAIATNQYCHNFFIMDHQPIGADYRIRYPFPPVAEIDNQQLGEVRGNDLTILKDLGGGALWAKISGWQGRDHNRAMIENSRSGQGVTIIGDFAPQQLVAYAKREALCHEPFIAIDLAPGNQLSWSLHYELTLPGAAGVSEK